MTLLTFVEFFKKLKKVKYFYLKKKTCRNVTQFTKIDQKLKCHDKKIT